MDKRYQVFVSSTFVDLRDARAEVIRALLELDCIPAGMELFPACDEAQWPLIKRVIDDCDYYVVIIGGRYGSIDESGISYTEREYDYALERGIPVLGFLHEDPDAIAVNKSDIDPLLRDRLRAFRTKVQKKMCKMWRTPSDLGGHVSRSLIQTIKLFPAEGWVRASHAASADQINSFRDQIDNLTRELEAARTQAPAEADRLAKGDEEFQVDYEIERLGISRPASVRLTWDEIISIVGPSMYDEAPERELRRQLAARIAYLYEESEFEVLRITENDFQTVKIQLLALGIIKKSIRKRGTKDTETYWSLTPYGEQYTTTLKAIRTTR